VVGEGGAVELGLERVNLVAALSGLLEKNVIEVFEVLNLVQRGIIIIYGSHWHGLRFDLGVFGFLRLRRRRNFLFGHIERKRRGLSRVLFCYLVTAAMLKGVALEGYIYI